MDNKDYILSHINDEPHILNKAYNLYMEYRTEPDPHTPDFIHKLQSTQGPHIYRVYIQILLFCKEEQIDNLETINLELLDEN
jgi:hypothetical protein